MLYPTQLMSLQPPSGVSKSFSSEAILKSLKEMTALSIAQTLM